MFFKYSISILIVFTHNEAQNMSFLEPSTTHEDRCYYKTFFIMPQINCRARISDCVSAQEIKTRILRSLGLLGLHTVIGYINAQTKLTC